jgi:hypothetical protein
VKRLTKGGLLIVVAFSIPLFVELRTVAGFVGVELPWIAVGVLAVLFYAALLLVYYLGQEPAAAAA